MILRFRRIVIHNKTINQTRTKKNGKNLTHRIGKIFSRQSSREISARLYSPWRFGAHRVSTDL